MQPVNVELFVDILSWRSFNELRPEELSQVIERLRTKSSADRLQIRSFDELDAEESRSASSVVVEAGYLGEPRIYLLAGIDPEEAPRFRLTASIGWADSAFDYAEGVAEHLAAIVSSVREGDAGAAAS